MKIVCVELPNEVARDLWPELQPYVEQALEYDVTLSTSIEDMREQVMNDWARVLICADQDHQGDGIAIESVTIIQAHVSNRDERLLHVIATAGSNSERWLPELIETLDQIAAEQQCEGVTLQGRPGWARKLRQYGFRTQQVLMRRKPGDSYGSIKQTPEREPAAEPGPEPAGVSAVH